MLRAHEGKAGEPGHQRGDPDVGDGHGSRPGVGARGHQVHGRQHVRDVAAHVDRVPDVPRQLVAQPGRDEHRRQQPCRDHAERHRARSPVRRERHEHVGDAEVHVRVRNESEDVDGDEGHGDLAHPLVDALQ